MVPQEAVWRTRQAWFLPLLVQSSTIILAGLLISYTPTSYKPGQSVLDLVL